MTEAELRAEVAAALRRKSHCTAGTCTRPIYSRFLCNAHYRRLLLRGTPEPDKPLRIASWKDTLCRNGCGLQVRARGLCSRCYNASMWQDRE